MLLIPLAAFFCSCARDLRVRMPGENPPETAGTIEVVLTRPASDVTVAVDGRLVARRAHTRRVVVSGVMAGISDVEIVAGSGAVRVERHTRVEVRVGETTSIPVAAPDPSTISELPKMLMTVVVLIASRFLYLAMF